jgi:hypothetical protein
MRKNITRSPAAKKGKSRRGVTRTNVPKVRKPSDTELDETDLDKVAGGAVGPCEGVRSPRNRV